MCNISWYDTIYYEYDTFNLDNATNEIYAHCTPGYWNRESPWCKVPDIILMDISMPKKNGIEATVSISAQNPDIRIIALPILFCVKVYQMYVYNIEC